MSGAGGSGGRRSRTLVDLVPILGAARAGLRGRATTLLVEVASISIAILLAATFDDWRQQRADARLAAEARDNLARELEANRARVRPLPAYHDSLSRALAPAIALPPFPTYDMPRHVPAFRGTRPAFVLGTAWDAAARTNALRLLPYKEVQALAYTYALQARLEELQRASGVAMLSPAGVGAADARPVMRALAIQLQEAAGVERELLRAYDETIPLLRRGAPRDPAGEAAASDTAAARGTAPAAPAARRAMPSARQ